MKNRVIAFVVFMICLWGGTYLLQADFTPRWVLYPLFVTVVVIGIPAFAKSVIAEMTNDHNP